MSHLLPRDVVVGTDIFTHGGGNILCDILFFKTTLQMLMPNFKTKCLDHSDAFFIKDTKNRFQFMTAF
jgi:hypothetical protein